MNKDAYYFPHFSNARNDNKLRRVRKELGVEGYGIYFMLLEKLREEEGLKYPTEDIDLLAEEFGTSEQKVRTVICNYKLFNVDDNDDFFSLKFMDYLQPYLYTKHKSRIDGIIGKHPIRGIKLSRFACGDYLPRLGEVVTKRPITFIFKHKSPLILRCKACKPEPVGGKEHQLDGFTSYRLKIVA